MNHNDHIPPHDGGLPVSGTDLFAPEAIDQSIARLLAPKAPDGADADAQLVRALAAEHTLPP